MDLTVIIPLYNEEESLTELHDWIVRVLSEAGYSYEIIFVDDGSKDHSWEIIERLASANPSVKGIRFRRNYGKAAALNTGFAASQGNVVVTMDADCRIAPMKFLSFYDMITRQGYDLVSGWKKKRYDPISKTLPTKLYNWATRKASRIRLHDFNCGLKAYRSDVVKSIEIYGEMHRYIPVIAKWAGFTRIGEKIVRHFPRKHGKSKYGWSRFIAGFLDLISISFIGRFGKKPMHFFGFLGSLLFLAGFVIAAYLAYAKFFMAGYKMTERPLFYFGLLAMVLGTQLFTAGFLGEMISRSAHDRNQYLIAQKLVLTKE